jgi:hypothetical protein
MCAGPDVGWRMTSARYRTSSRRRYRCWIENRADGRRGPEAFLQSLTPLLFVFDHEAFGRVFVAQEVLEV